MGPCTAVYKGMGPFFISIAVIWIIPPHPLWVVYYVILAMAMAAAAAAAAVIRPEHAEGGHNHENRVFIDPMLFSD